MKTGQFGDEINRSSFVRHEKNLGRATMGRFAENEINRRQNRFTVGIERNSVPHVSIEDCPVMLGIRSDNFMQAVNEYQ